MANLRLVFPSMTARDVASWQGFFRRASRLEATYTAESLRVKSSVARAMVLAAYRFVPEGGGAQREERARLTMRFTKTPNGWRVAAVQELKK